MWPCSGESLPDQCCLPRLTSPLPCSLRFLLIAQVVLALQLPVTLVPLIKATSSRQLMGPHASSRLLAGAAWAATGLVFLANLLLFVTQMLPEVSSGRGEG